MPKKINMKTAAGSVIYPTLFGAAVIISWQTGFLHKLLKTDEYVLPYPTKILHIMHENSDKIMLNVQASVKVALLGLLLGSLIGYFIAIIATVFPKYGSGGLTIVSAFNAIPIVALAPVFINWTKDVSEEAEVRSMVAKVLVVTVTSMAAMSVNAYRGLTELPPFSDDLMKTYAAGKVTGFFKLCLPNSLPYIFTALRVSVPGSVIGALVSEYFAEYIIGVGRQIRENILIAQYATAWAYIITACIIGIAMYIVLMIVETIALRKRK